MKNLVFVPLLALSFSFINPCSPDSRHVKKAPQDTDRIYDVEVAYPKFEDVARVHDVDGIFEPAETHTVTAAAGGEVEEILVTVGDKVSENDPLIKLASATLDDLAGIKRLRVKELEIRLKNARDSFQGMAVPDRPVTNEEVDFLDEEPLDEAAQRRNSEETESVKKEKPDPVTLKDLVGVIETQIERLNHEVLAIEAKLKFLQHVSPVNGVVTKIHTTQKNHVHEGDMLIEVARMEPMAVTFDLPQDVASFVDKYCKVTVAPKEAPEVQVAGTVSFISPNLDQKTGSIRVRAEVINPNQKIRGGQAARVHVETRKVDSAMAVEPQAVVTVAGSSHVFVVHDNFVEKVAVRVVRELADGKVEIVSDVRVDDPVVIHPPVDLMDGAFVRTLEKNEAAQMGH